MLIDVQLTKVGTLPPCWDFASMLGLANMGGTWDLGIHVNQAYVSNHAAYILH